MLQFKILQILKTKDAPCNKEKSQLFLNSHVTICKSPFTKVSLPTVSFMLEKVANKLECT